MENCFVEKSQTPEEFYEKKKKTFMEWNLEKQNENMSAPKGNQR